MRRSPPAGSPGGVRVGSCPPACDGVPDDGPVPVRPGRLRRGRDEGDRVAEPVGMLGCRLVGVDRGITQARKRLGRKVMAEVFEGVAEPVAPRFARGSWLRRWRLLAIDGFEVDVPDSPGNAAEFDYAGSGTNRSAFPKARVVAIAECGTHTFLAEPGTAHLVRVSEYNVMDREGNGTGEVIVLLTNIV